MQVLNVLNGIMLVMGIWLVTVTFSMKKKKTVPSLLIPEEDKGKLHDHAAFIARIYVPMLILSVTMTVVALVGLILALAASVKIYRYIELVLFLVSLFWFLKNYQDAMTDLVH